MSRAGFFIANFMKYKTNTAEDRDLNEIAEQWVEILLSQIKANKQSKVNTSINNDRHSSHKDNI